MNTLRDGGNDKTNDGVIFSNDTLRFKGNGTLNIISGNAHGIASDDGIIFENGIYNITSIKSGLFAHDDVTINGGTLDIKGGTNGIKSKGTLNINGGTAVVSGGTKEEKSSRPPQAGFNTLTAISLRQATRCPCRVTLLTPTSSQTLGSLRLPERQLKWSLTTCRCAALRLTTTSAV